MRIVSLKVWTLRIPLKVAFKHASASRNVTESIWVEAADEDGRVGYGEGCPRDYVSGETVESCLRFFSERQNDLRERVRSLEDLMSWVSEHRAQIDRAPAAWCALELAILDLIVRRNSTTVEALLGLPELQGEFRFTAVLGDQADRTFAKQLRQYLKWGFDSFKIKLSRDAAANLRKMEIVSEARIRRDQVRADANNLWTDSSQAVAEVEPIANSFHAIEEPLASGDYDGMRRLSEACNLSVILDESFLRLEHFAMLEERPAHWIVNLRISKMGGLIRSLEVARRAVDRKLPLIIGAQVGETSLLTRTALTVANFARNDLYAQEGAFGTHLLETDVTDPPLMFGAGGRLKVQRQAPAKVVRPVCHFG